MDSKRFANGIELSVDHLYRVEYQCRDIGYGEDDGDDIFVYRGIESGGKHVFEAEGGPTVYLFDDEIVALAHALYTVLEHERGGAEVWDCEAFAPWRMVAGPFTGPTAQAQARAALANYRTLTVPGSERS